MKSEKPKVCFDLAGKSLVQRVVDTSLKIKAELIGVVVGFKKEMVVYTISISSSTVLQFITQESQNGTGDAVKCCKEAFKDFDGVVYILCGDVPLLKAETLQNMYDKHISSGANCTVLTMFLDDPDKYGRIVRDNKGQVREIIEFKDASDEIRKINEINTGIYCFNSKDLFFALDNVTNNNAQNEYYLTDVLKIMYEANLKIESVVLKDIAEATGVNSQVQLAELEKDHYTAILKHWMDNGVSIEKPETVLIEDDVVIENDVYISAFTKIKGCTVIGKNTFIGSHCVIIDSILEAGSRLEGMNVVKDYKGDLVLDWYESVF